MRNWPSRMRIPRPAGRKLQRLCGDCLGCQFWRDGWYLTYGCWTSVESAITEPWRKLFESFSLRHRQFQRMGNDLCGCGSQWMERCHHGWRRRNCICKIIWIGRCSKCNYHHLAEFRVLLQNATFCDFNNDGWIDLFCCDDNAAAHMYLNDGAGKSSIVNDGKFCRKSRSKLRRWSGGFR